MKNYFSTSFLILFLVTSVTAIAQKKNISLEDIWSGKFRTEGLQALHSLENGKEYAVLNFNRSTRSSTVDVYDYKSGNKVRTLIDTKNVAGLDRILSYELSADESKMLIATDLESIYRRSALGDYVLYDLKTKQLTKISEDKIQEPHLTKAGDKVAFGKDNNLFVKDLATGTVKQITQDGKKNSIINGITDWVYEEEFAFVRAFDWNADGTKLAFIRFDETDVPRFSMDVYGNTLYPSQQVFKYPKAGDPNAVVSLHMYDVASGKTEMVDLNAFDSYYIPRIEWTSDKDVLSVQVTGRKQNELDLLFVNAENNKASLILKDTDAAYVDVRDDLTFLEDNSFIWTSEKDGWNHIYHYDKTGALINQITKGDWEVTRYYGFDAASDRIFFQSTENGSINRDVYSVKTNGKGKQRLTTQTGTNSAAFSADFTYFINTFHNADTPYAYTLNDAKSGKVVRKIKDNTDLKDTLEGYTISEKEFSTINVNGEALNMYMIKPKDFDPSKKYPLFMYQYSGPGSQSVSNSWNGSNDYWHQMLAQDGFIVACVDGRGTGLKGRDFKKVTQNELGKYEVEDQIAVAKKLGAMPFIDADRIGIWGWSYGGFMSSNCLFQGADTFAMAIAVAPVTSWRFYDTIYTERYMSTPQLNASGYDNNSPMSHVAKLEGDFLLVHGSADDNVHVQNTTRLVEALVQADKQFDWAIYPDKNHGIYGGNTRLHLYKKMTNFVKASLGN
ncbi:dipeptidyl aminopeptidase IV [unidentified eubacterium SCB49]|nr:dipeptidyl aminopeptidase IV [unidentified eubacterium SCB49]